MNYLLSKSWGHHTFALGATDAQGRPLATTYPDANAKLQALDTDRTTRLARFNQAAGAANAQTMATMPGLPPTASLITVRNRADNIAGVSSRRCCARPRSRCQRSRASTASSAARECCPRWSPGRWAGPRSAQSADPLAGFWCPDAALSQYRERRGS